MFDGVFDNSFVISPTPVDVWSVLYRPKNFAEKARINAGCVLIEFSFGTVNLLINLKLTKLEPGNIFRDLFIKLPWRIMSSYF